MAKNSKFRDYAIRLGIVFIGSLIFVFIINEISFQFLKDKHDRAPETILLEIPEGTAEKIASGENDVSIPDELVFVLGDVLVVKNNDDVSHQMGPLWIPAGTSASLVMEKVDSLAYSCSFQTSRYLGIDIRQPTTINTRITALALSAPTMTILIFVYSLLIFPINSTQEKQVTEGEPGNNKADFDHGKKPIS
ncbi:hypothetical protein ACFLUC_00620 [Chloroflexota bacterium]